MNRSLRVLLFAHHHVGVSVLRGLLDAGHDVAHCFTHPQTEDWIPSVAAACESAGVACSDGAPGSVDAFRENRPDLIVSAGYRRRVGLPFLGLPRLGSINAHLAPLPRYRGSSPIPWALLHRETSWAVTVHAMTHNYNDGGVLRRQPVPLRESDNAYDLFIRSGDAAARAMVETVNQFADGSVDTSPQELRAIQFFDQAKPFGGRVDWNQSATDLAAFVRAMDFGRGDVENYEHLAAPATATLNGQEIGIWRARAGGTASPFPPGTLTRCNGQVWVQTGRGHLVLEQLCDATGADHTAEDYLAAHGVTVGQSFDTRQAWRPAETAQLNFAA